MKKYYEPCPTTDKDGNNIDLNDLYPEFKTYQSKQNFKFYKIFLGFTFLVWWRFALFMTTIISLNLALRYFLKNKKPGETLNSNHRLYVEVLGSMGMWIVLNFVLGLFYTEKKIKDFDILRKYLGPRYDDKKVFSVIISNHTSYIDAFVFGKMFAPAFAGKAAIKNVPLIGYIADCLEAMWIERESKEQTSIVAQQMYKRQTDYMCRRVLSPLLVFPEGTVTSGRHLLIFRSGAFEHQLPVKPFVLVNDDGDGVSITTGGMNQGLHWLYILGVLYTNNLTVLELPTIYPTDFMFEHHSDGVENKTHVFANVTRKIMAEISGLKLSDKTIKHSFEYDNKIRGNSDMKKQPLF